MWMLFTILLKANQFYVKPNGPFVDMATCFEAREVILKQFPEPKVNYEAVCVKTDFFGEGI